ncbi:MAG TPA: LppX_LprAFG lipoprotein [Chloroflexota bacterium]|nr:LppX_LprAFG lipoprotein [Chloroflexota bacterium]
MLRSIALASLLLVLLACGRSTPPEPTAEEIRQRSADAMARLASFRFKLDVLNGAMPLGGGLAATSVEGAVVAPDRLRMLVKARMGNLALELQTVAVGDRQYLTNPLSGQWQDATGTLLLPSLLDPERGVEPLLRRAERLEKRGRANQDGVDAYHLAGPVPAEALARVVGGAAPASGSVESELWIGAADFRLRRARLVGAVVADEPPNLERVLTLSDFDAQIQIEPPT